jgi:hypothetical protein
MHFSERSAIAHRVWKLDAGLRYIEATPETERAADVPDMDVRIGPRTTKPFAECSIAEIEDAIALVKQERGDDVKRALPRGAGGTVKRLERELSSAGATEDDDRPTMRTEVARRGGRARVYVVVRAPLETLHLAARALLRGLGKR